MSGDVAVQTTVVEHLDFRACCGKLRWALLDMVEGLAGQNACLRALRWGTGEVPLDIDVDACPPGEVVETVLSETARFLGASSSCFTGGGSLVVEHRPSTGGASR